jgi:hypothetical protein
MLVVVSSPVDLPKLDVDAEYEHVKESLALAEGAGYIRIQRLPKPTIAELAKWLRDHEVNVLHFIGHGDYLPARGEGVIYFTDDAGKAFPVSADVLGPYAQDHDPLRLVVLNACRTASSGEADGTGGLAQGLVRRDIGAVVAMQFPISDGAASTFSREFYGATADGFPVDQAVTNARKALLAEFGSEWATPVLFLRSSDGVVFDPTSVGAAAVATAGPVAEPTPPGVPERRPTAPVADPPVEAQPLAPPADEPIAREPVLVAPDPVPVVAEPVPLVAERGTAGPARDSVALEPVVREPVVSEPRPAPRPEQQQAPPRNRRWLYTGLAAGVALAIVAAFLLVQRLRPEPDPTLTGPALQAAFFQTPPTIDGDASEWAGRTAFTTPVVIVPTTKGARPTVSSSWRLGWDADNYYALVVVRDPVITQTNAGRLSQLFNGDGISFELGTELRPDPSATDLPADDVHVMFGVTPDGKVLRGMNVARGGTFEPGEDLTGGSAAVRIQPGVGYVIELALPWSAVGIGGVDKGALLATNLVVSDAFSTGDKRGRLKTMETNNPGRQTNAVKFRSAWGTVELVG